MRTGDARRAQERTARIETAPMDAVRVEHEPAMAAPSAEEPVLAGLEFGDVGTALDRISPELRDVLRATVVDGLTTRETARLLGIPEGTVKTRAMHARTELRATLAQLAPTPMGGPA
jgi:RNA polymerase sigma-70 factor (ECF subfamily)